MAERKATGGRKGAQMAEGRHRPGPMAGEMAVGNGANRPPRGRSAAVATVSASSLLHQIGIAVIKLLFWGAVTTLLPERTPWARETSSLARAKATRRSGGQMRGGAPRLEEMALIHAEALALQRVSVGEFGGCVRGDRERLQENVEELADVCYA